MVVVWKIIAQVLHVPAVFHDGPRGLRVELAGRAQLAPGRRNDAARLACFARFGTTCEW